MSQGVSRLLVAGIVIGALLTSTLRAEAEQGSGSGVEVSFSEQQAALAALEGYNQALVERNYSTLRDQFLYAPFVIVDDASRVITSIETIVDGLRRTRESLDAAEYATTKIGAPRVTVLGRDRLLINCRLSHLKKDGTVLADRANFYMMVKVAGAWKIGGIIVQDPAFFDR